MCKVLRHAERHETSSLRYALDYGRFLADSQHVLTLALIACCGACGRPGGEKMQAPIAHDPSSYANISAFVTTHLVLDLTTDFGARVMSGQVSLSFERRDPVRHRARAGHAGSHHSKDRSGDRLGRVGRDAVQAGSGDAGIRQRPAHHDAAGSRPRARHVRHVAGRQGPAVADAGTDGGPEASVPVQPGAGDPGAVVHSVAGHTRPCA